MGRFAQATGRRAGRTESVEVAVEEVGFVEAEVVAQFVEIGYADFFEVVGEGFFGVFPDVGEEEEDFGGEGVGVGGLVEGGADEEAEGVGLNAVAEKGGIGAGEVGDGDFGGGGADGRGEGGEKAADFGFGEGLEAGEFQVASD